MHKIASIIGISAVLTACSTSQKATTDSQNLTWHKTYGGTPKNYDTELIAFAEKIAPKFKTLEFKDAVTGKTMAYNLFIPKNYNPQQQYPLVLFMGDASTVAKPSDAPLKQGYGATIWATDESQKENPCFVLSPAFSGPERVTNDQSQVTDEADMAYRLLQSVVSSYAIDTNRLYTTGQSMGGMLSFYYNSKYPKTFAATLYVGSQWDTKVLDPLENQKFFYIVSAGDMKASEGMQALKDKFKADSISFAQTEFSAQLKKKEQNTKIKELLQQGNTRNFVTFEKGTTLPEGVAPNPKAGEHMYSFDFAYQIKAVRDWIFQQKKGE